MAKIVPIFYQRWSSLFGKIVNRAGQLNAETNSWLIRTSDGVLLAREGQTPLVQCNYELRDDHCAIDTSTTTAIDVPLDNSRLHIAHEKSTNTIFDLIQDEYHGMFYRPTKDWPRPNTLSLFRSPIQPDGTILHVSTEQANDNEGPSAYMMLPYKDDPSQVNHFRVDATDRAYACEQLGPGISSPAEAAAFMDDGPYGLAFQRMTTMLGTMSLLAGEDPRRPFGS